MTTKVSGFSGGFRPVFLRKKERSGILEDDSGGKSIGLKVQNNCSWGSETGDTTKSESIDMKKKFLVKETSFDYGESDISLDNVVGNSVQKKLVVVRKLFSKINGFGGASAPSKFARIIRITFTSELSLVQASKKTKDVKILVNTNLKKSTDCSD
ncbi:hypothetical protein G9A89_003983 [Geosiphon pyriformis]|nr:hypothetical protein G9A89_003983 [Geosiphon pyriformis]